MTNFIKDLSSFYVIRFEHLVLLIFLLGCAQQAIPTDEVFTPEPVQPPVKPIPQLVQTIQEPVKQSIPVPPPETDFVECFDSVCFDKRFRECKPAQYAINMGGTVWRYKIFGKRNNGCLVRSTNLAHPESKYEGQSMDCIYDNVLPFRIAIQNFDDCEGYLSYLLTMHLRKKIPVTKDDYVPKPVEKKITPTKTVQVSKPNLVVDIIFPKSSYEVGESLSGARYYIENNGPAFDAAIHYTFDRVGVNWPSYGVSITNLKTGPDSIHNKFNLMAFKLNSEEYNANLPYFFEEGTYIYGISIFDCNELKSKYGKDCSSMRSKDFAKYQPLISKTKNVVISGGAIVSECTHRDHCTDLCTNCKEGKEMCDVSSEKCVQCIGSVSCKEGSTCVNSVCV